MAKKLLLKTEIKRKKGKLYYCGTTEDGMIAIFETDMGRPTKDKKIEKTEKKK